MPSDDRTLALEAAVEDVFAVHDVTVRGHGEVVVFAGQYLRSPEMVFDAVSERFRAQGFMPLLRREGGRDVLVAYPAPAIAGTPRTWLNAALMVATVFTTVLAGTFQALPATATIASLRDFLGFWPLGVPFAAALLGILGVHELGHYFAARRYRMDVTLPYFIPLPNMFTGTLGAVIRIRSPFESRRSLFDVGIAGPVAGLLVAIPVVAIGLARAQMMTVAPNGSDVMIFNEPLLFQAMARIIAGPRPAGMDIVMNPLLLAGWWGFFLTALNLLPVSQLDGGHVAYALLGHRHRVLAWATVAAVAAVALYTRNLGFFVMLGLIVLMGVDHPPALNDLTPIGRGRRVLGVAVFVLWLLLVTPDPFGGML
jgi:membrane-associated protease RseP (regulator of RpoE activity)